MQRRPMTLKPSVSRGLIPGRRPDKVAAILAPRPGADGLAETVMLDGMRKASQGLIGRIVMAIVMGFIILSFAVWGIGDIFSGFGANIVATVGSQDITAEQVRYNYQTQLQNLQQQYRSAITSEQARAFGLDTQV